MVHQIDRKHDRNEFESVYKRGDLYTPRNGDGVREPGIDKRSLLLGMGLTIMLGLGAFAAGELTQSWLNKPAEQRTFTPPIVEQATKIPGLQQAQSLITGIVDPETLTASYYWTFVVHNSSAAQQEAQIELALPDASAVSRATLWINGVAQEAAFNETWKVEKAYNWITKLHRDPLLVTQTSPGHILIKASPVMPGENMQFRIGITAAGDLQDGQAQFALPRIVSTNFGDIGSHHDVHIVSNAPLYSNNPQLQTLLTGKNGYLSRGNLDKLDDLTLRAARSFGANTFATRATHSFPAGYIVGRVDDNGEGQAKLHLTKSISKPDCRYIDDEATAYRLSTLWAFGEIERLWSGGNGPQARQLANVYRVVSSVSGATVLETESDYQHEGLDRNMYLSLSYVPNSTSSNGYIVGDAFATTDTAGSGNVGLNDNGGTFNTLSQTRSNSLLAQLAPLLQGATSGTIGPQGTDATVINSVNTAGTVRVNNLANAEAALNIIGTGSGPVGAATINWLVASARDANLFGGEPSSPAGGLTELLLMGPFEVVSVAALALLVFGLVVINFAGPVLVFGKAIKEGSTRPRQSGKTAALGFLWLTAAICVPLVSQLAFIWVALKRIDRRKMKPATAPAGPAP